MLGEGKAGDIVLIDSCIVIDFIKGIEKIKNQVIQIPQPCINFIVEMELLVGARNKRDSAKIEKELASFNLLAFHDGIAKLATALIKAYYLSHNLQLADSIIAATALIYDIPLFTNNIKDFHYIPNLLLYPFNPRPSK